MLWNSTELGHSAESVIPKSLKVSAYMTLRLLPPSKSTLERRFKPTIGSTMRPNRVFDVIGFVYPDYCYPTQKQGRKRKAATSTSTGVSRSKKIKVLTCRPRRIETADVPKLSEMVETTPWP
jgi:hypothetical protein